MTPLIFEGLVDTDTPLEAAARAAGWALMELVDGIAWEKRTQVLDIVGHLAKALSSDEVLSAAPAGEFARTFIVEGRQVLLYIEPHEEKDYVLHQKAYSAAFGAMIDIAVEFNIVADPPRDADPFETLIARSGDARAAKFIRTVIDLEGRGAA